MESISKVIWKGETSSKKTVVVPVTEQDIKEYKYFKDLEDAVLHFLTVKKVYSDVLNTEERGRLFMSIKFSFEIAMAGLEKTVRSYFLSDLYKFENEKVHIKLMVDRVRKINLSLFDENAELKNNIIKLEKQLSESSQLKFNKEDCERQITELQINLSNNNNEFNQAKQQLIIGAAEKDELLRNRELEFEQLQEKHLKLEQEFKEFIIFLIGREGETLKDEPLHLIKKLFLISTQDRKAIKSHPASFPIREERGAEEDDTDEDGSSSPSESLEEFDFEDEDYLDSLKCFCGREKSQTAKGCNLHRSKAKSIAVARNLGMGTAWNIIYQNWRGRT